MRILLMMMVCVGVGVLIGVNSMLDEGGLLELVAGAIAGVIIMLPLGVFLGLIGGQVKQTIVGATWGLVVGMAAAFTVEGQITADALNVSLTVGVLVGATFPQLYRRLVATMTTLMLCSRHMASVVCAAPSSADPNG
jgi:hypothetical protein